MNWPAEHPSNDGRASYGSGRPPRATEGAKGRPSVSDGGGSAGRSARLRVATLNMKGYGRAAPGGGSDKSYAINQIVKEGRLAVLALQEAHLTAGRIESLNDLFAAQLCVVGSPDDENQTGACGVAFAVAKKHLKGTEVGTEVIKPGRAMQITMRWTATRKISILNVYAPNDATENARFWDELRTWYEEHGRMKPDIMMGDFNVVEDSMDRLPARMDPYRATAALGAFCSRINVIDTWRRAHPTERMFTYHQTGGSIQSRLDRIYVKQALSQTIAGWESKVPGVATDHSMVSCSLANYGDPKMGKGRWALPPNLLDDKQFIEAMKRRAAELEAKRKASTARSETENPQVWLKTFKDQLKKDARERTKIRASKIDRKLAHLNELLRAQLNNGVSPPSQSERETAAIIRCDIHELEMKRLGARKAATAAKDWVLGEKVGKYWTRINAAPKEDNTMYELAREGENERTYANSTGEMCEIAKSFFDELQNVDPPESAETHERDISEVLKDECKRLPSQLKAPMATAITVAEVMNAIDEAATGKAPGLDGLPVSTLR